MAPLRLLAAILAHAKPGAGLHVTGDRLAVSGRQRRKQLETRKRALRKLTDITGKL
jgi:hypothetical protein